MPEIPSIDKLADVLFDAFKDRFKKSDVWEGQPDVDRLKFAAKLAARVTHEILTANSEAERKHHEETLEIVHEAISMKIVEKQIKLNKFGRDLLGEVVKIAAKAAVGALIGII